VIEYLRVQKYDLFLVFGTICKDLSKKILKIHDIANTFTNFVAKN